MEKPQDLEHRIAAYLAYKMKDFSLIDTEPMMSSETKLSFPVKPGTCSYCNRPALYICSNCKCWYCTNYCRKKHWNVHKSSCVPRTLVFQNGVPLYKSLSEDPCSEDEKASVSYEHFEAHWRSSRGSEHENRCSTPFSESKIGETVCDEHIEHNYEDNIEEGEFENGGKIVTLPWEPALEEAGLDCINIPSGSRVNISAYYSPAAIYVHSCDPKHKKMHCKIQQDVASFTKGGEPLKRKPLIGELLACRYIEDGYYYRAQVFLKEGDKYKVNFVDYGNTEVVSQQDMKYLPEDLKMVPCSAVRIGLKDVVDVPFNTQCMKFLNELAVDSIEIFLTYENYLRQATLELYEGEILNNILRSFLEPSWEKKDLSERSTHIYMSTDIKYDTWKKGSIFEIAVAYALRHDRVLAFSPASGVHDHVHDTMTPNITEYCESIPDELYNPRRFEVCLAKFHEDGRWYRALCLQSYQHNVAKVFYIDYGNTAEVPHSCLRKMIPEFMETPAVIKCCKIYGLPVKLPEATKTAMVDYLSTFRGDAKLLKEFEDGKSIIWIPALASLAPQFGISIEYPN